MQVCIVNKSHISARLTVNMFRRMGFNNITVVPDYKTIASCLSNRNEVWNCFSDNGNNNGNNNRNKNLIVLCENKLYARDVKILKADLDTNTCIILTTEIFPKYGVDLYLHFSNLFYLVTPFYYSSLHSLVSLYLEKVKQMTEPS